MLDATDNEEHKAKRQKINDMAQKVKEVHEDTRKITSSICFQGSGILNQTVLNTVVAYNNAKKQENEEMNERKAARCQKTIDKAKALLAMKKEPSDYKAN